LIEFVGATVDPVYASIYRYPYVEVPLDATVVTDVSAPRNR
jgi:hypothetical protein